jgi:hypothetical protein
VCKAGSGSERAAERAEAAANALLEVPDLLAKLAEYRAQLRVREVAPSGCADTRDAETHSGGCELVIRFG